MTRDGMVPEVILVLSQRAVLAFLAKTIRFA